MLWMPLDGKEAHTHYFLTRVDGKQHWEPLGNDYGEALRRWAELTGAASSPVMTVADALAHYLEDREKRLAEKTTIGYRAQSARLCKVFGAMRLSDLKRSQVVTYLKKRGNVAGNRERDLLRAAINHARNLGFNGENPCKDMQYRNAESPRLPYITDGELVALLTAAQPRVAPLIRWLYFTGMRTGDAIAFQMTGAGEDGIRWQESKTGRERFVVWSDELLSVYKAAAGALIGAQALFLGQRGPYSLDGVESTWARVRERAKVQNVTMHDLRRKGATDVGSDHAQELLGHADKRVTRRHYIAKPASVKPVK